MSEPLDDLLAAPDMPKAPSHRWLWLKPLKLSLMALVIALVAWALIRQWRALESSAVPIHIRPLPLIAALLSMIAVACVQLLSYRSLLAAYADAPPWRAMPTIAWVPPLGKYVPGAAPLAAMAILKRVGVQVGAAVSVVLTLDGLAVVAGLITGAPLLLWKPVAERYPHLWIIAVPIIIGGAICLAPPIFTAAINYLLRKLKKQPLAQSPPARAYFLPVFCAFAQWFFSGLALLFILNSVAPASTGVAWQQLLLMISFAALSQTIGYLVLFAPGGLGVREGILLVCFTPLVGPLAAVIVPIRAIAQIVVDIGLAGIGAACARRSGRNKL